MRYVDEYRDSALCRKLSCAINAQARTRRSYSIMEVCGTHTMNIFRSGIRDILPDNIRLISGPGCPVCVTPIEQIDRSIAYAMMDDTIISVFGDMLKVPGSSQNTLERAIAAGAKVSVVYSPLDALEIARENKDRRVIFIGVGFETTAPAVAATILQARRKKITNFSALSLHKTMPNALKYLVAELDPAIDGFLLPGHVSAIIGSAPYSFLAGRLKMPCAITGFEPLDILQGIYSLIRQINSKKSVVDVPYGRVVSRQGNRKALAVLKEVFIAADSDWRGIGSIPKSGLKIRRAYRDYDIEFIRPVKVRSREPSGCRCPDVIKGLIEPPACALFGTKCTSAHPVGACMVSSEGTCAAYYKYRRPIAR